jgi:Xaa-Pro aminopeptidase
MYNMSNYALRRQEFLAALGNRVGVIVGGTPAARNNDVDYEFRQDSDFYFLTGFGEPDAVAIFNPNHETQKYVLLVRPRDREMEIWNGYRAGVDGAVEAFGADAAYPISEIADQLTEHLVGVGRLVYQIGGRLDNSVLGKLASIQLLASRFGRTVPTSIDDPRTILEDMRLHKNAAEAELLQRACDISMEGHLVAMAVTQPGMYEYQTQAAMEQVFRTAGSPRNGYPSVVASGRNACILHYTESTAQMVDGDLLLIDAAAEHEQYSSDITRTFPVNGTFTAPQRAMYEIVLAAHSAGIEAAQLGLPVLGMHKAAVRVVSEGLVDLGLVPLGLDDTIAMHHYREFFMHGTGHWLGLDVHDCGAVVVPDGDRTLEVGMSFTVEPGLYIDRPQAEFASEVYDHIVRMERRYRMGWDAARTLEAEERAALKIMTVDIPAELQGIGIRIEDDLLVTSSGTINMTAALPTQIDEVEAACQV